jgi:hypothetical protein
MANASETQRINTTDSPRAVPRSSRASTYRCGAVVPIKTGAGAFAWPVPRPTGLEPAETPADRLTATSANLSRVAEWARIITVGLVMIAAVVALDLLVLSIAAGRLIEHLPF